MQRIPLGNATDAQIIEFYSSGGESNLVIAGMYMMPFAGIALLYFMVFLRTLAGSTGVQISSILSNIQLLAGTIFIGLLFTAAAASTSTAAGLQFASAEMDPNFARQLPIFSSTLLIGFAMRMTAMFVFTTSSIGLATKLAQVVRLYWLRRGRISAAERLDHQLVCACLPRLGHRALADRVVAHVALGGLSGGDTPKSRPQERLICVMVVDAQRRIGNVILTSDLGT